MLGDPLPERVMAFDLMERLLEVAETKGYRIFILGATQEVLELAIANIRTQYPLLAIAGYRNGYFGPEDDEEIVAEIRESRADMLFVAMPSPKKEYWLADHREVLGVPFMMGVGGEVVVLAGVINRAPRLIQRSGFEWLDRVAQEPRRLFRRSMVGNAKFLWLLRKELVAQRRQGS
jgi:N-acetylglucosaminyldiphosphoundecaprenol N-acetyl-beta-D-mannosaminyltransferase